MTTRSSIVWRFTWAELRRDHSAWVALVGLALASLAASLNGLHEVSRTERAIVEAHSLAAEKLQRAKADGMAIVAGARPRPSYWLNPADVRGFAYYEMVAFAVKPPTPAAALSLGSLDVLPSYVRTMANSTAPFAQAYDLDNPHRLALGHIDPSFVAIYVLPLVLVGLGYHTVARERAGSRLALLMVHSVTPAQLVTARVGVRAIAATAICALASVAPVWWASGGNGTTRVIVWVLVLVAYAAMWTTLIAVVVARASGQAMAVSVLGALWVAATLAAPWTLAVAAESLFPSPSRVKQILEERDGIDRVEAGGAAEIDRYVTEHPEMGVNADATMRDLYTAQQIAFNSAIEERIAANDQALEIQLARRQTLVDRLSWIVPPVLAAEAMVDLSGTGWQRHRAFLQQGREYVARLRAYFDPRTLRGEFEFSDWDDWPQFEWQEPSATPAVARALGALAGLVAGAVGLAAWARRLLQRLSPSGARG
jgi:ABC-2 type transport system permease protein